MTTHQAVTRADTVRRRRNNTSSSPQPPPTKIKRNYRPEKILTSQLTKGSVSKKVNQSRNVNYSANRRHYDIAFNTPHARVQTPGISLPGFGPRSISGILAIGFVLIIITLWNSTLFKVSGVKLIGNERITENEVNTLIQYLGKPVFSVLPKRLEEDLKLAFPEIETISVSLSIPNQVIVSIKERIPAIIWQQTDGTMFWIDSKGVKFPAREQIDNLATVLAYGDPPGTIIGSENEDISTNAGVFLDPSIIETIITMVGIAPQGSTLSYDPIYGLGWTDPQGWLVYFGENIEDISQKLIVYQAIIDKLSQQGIQPTLISVEYLDAPFYRTE